MRVRKPSEGSAPAWCAAVAGLARLLALVTCAGILTLRTDWAAAGTLVGPGQDDFDREVGSIDGDGYTLNYELFRPPGHEAEGALPLVLYLHGYGDGRDFKQSRLNETIEDLVYTTQHENSERGVDPALAPQMDQQYESYLLVPKIPVREGWSPRLGLARQLLDQVVSSYEIDTRRTYLAGFSDGGFRMPYMIERNPGTFAAGVSFAGGGFPSPATAAALRDVPLWFFHDRTDPTVDYEYSVHMVDALIAAGGSPNLTLYNGGYGYAHDSWKPALRDEDNTFYPWLFSQAVPEPGTGVLLLLGVAGWFLMRGAGFLKGYPFRIG